MLNKIINSFIAIATLISLIGCQTAESIRYIHEPSSVFYEDLNINHKEIEPFIDDGILIVSSIVEADFGLYWIWLGVYTEKRTDSIEIKKVDLIGNGLKKEIVINKQFLISETEQRDSQIYNLRTNGVKLLEINAEDLSRFINEKDTMLLKVTYVLEDQIKEMTFIIEKKVEKRLVYPT